VKQVVCVSLVMSGVAVVAAAHAGPANGLGDDGPSSSVMPASLSVDPSSRSCPADTIEIKGEYCPELEQKCVRHMPEEKGAPERCAVFAPSKCKSQKVKKHFCIDPYEYPNRRGEKPVVMKSWQEAQDLCKAAQKRLCRDSEWTLACEGQEHLPYPYGRTRDAKACNIDRPHPPVDERALASSDPQKREAEVQRLWQGEPSGARPGCASPYGVMDMTGNVDEWVVNESGKPFKSGLKGGYWGPVRDRCRPMTTAHGETFPFYQTGFRCCADPANGTLTAER
jgi:formylglycine-generating enzyme